MKKLEKVTKEIQELQDRIKEHGYYDYGADERRLYSLKLQKESIEMGTVYNCDKCGIETDNREMKDYKHLGELIVCDHCDETLTEKEEKRVYLYVVTKESPSQGEAINFKDNLKGAIDAFAMLEAVNEHGFIEYMDITVNDKSMKSYPYKQSKGAM